MMYAAKEFGVVSVLKYIKPNNSIQFKGVRDPSCLEAAIINHCI